ncbi:peptide ABC transporter substrate-binding protein [Candidatus Haliotispira prima]|uniref:Peptide ABC transporter substrate-binding protein n=1 Tax=Candidatus Haliotispira prima TaxID=3034016 RepID=A0ABY8MGG2_9SPIO|nr:peptide ABC transporter substrate-binding protein [Candidatus Haliotispira prima]
MKISIWLRLIWLRLTWLRLAPYFLGLTCLLLSFYYAESPVGVAGLPAQTNDSRENPEPEDSPDARSVREEQILSEVHRQRAQSEINIVMDYSDRLQWNPLFSYTANEAQLHIALFEGLLAYDPVDMTPRPGLAESWRRSSDGLRYTFDLRRNARFSNGEQIDADTVARTWFFLIKSGSKAPFSSLLDLVAGVKEYRDGKISRDATGIRVVNPYELELTLEHPGPEILAILCHHSLSPLPSYMLTEQGWSAFNRGLYSSVSRPKGLNGSKGVNGSEGLEGTKEPNESDVLQQEEGEPLTGRGKLVSNGPYRLESVSEAGIRLEANSDYWNAENVASKTIFIQKYYGWQDTDIGEAINSYKIDWIASGFSDFNQLRRGSELVNVGRLFSTTFFYFADSNSPLSPWSDMKVRRALALLLPLEKLRGGLGGDSHLVPEMPGFKSGKSLEKQDKQEALRLLEAAGYPEGEGLGTLTLRFPEGPTYEHFVAMIREVWSELKCEVEVQYGNPAIVSEGRADESSGDADAEPAPFTLGVLSWIGDYPDPTTFLNLWRSGSSLNLFNHGDPDYDKLLDRARQAGSREKRLELLSRAEEYLLEHGTVIPLWHSPSFNLYDKRFLDGFHQNILDLHPLQTLRRVYRLPKGSA